MAIFFFCGDTAFILKLTYISSTKFCLITRLQKVNEVPENTFEIDVSNEISS